MKDLIDGILTLIALTIVLLTCTPGGWLLSLVLLGLVIRGCS